MHKIAGFIIAFWLALPLGLWAQNQSLPTTRTCAAEQVRAQDIQQNPALRLRLEQAKQNARHYDLNKRNARLTRPVTQIPVVFHVLYNTPEQNISDAQILSQLEVLNQDYRHRNADSVKTLPAFKKLAADTGIQFCLAKIDPNGQPTSGIIRRFTNRFAFNFGDPMIYGSQEGSPIWNRDKYLNIWVCNLTNNTLGFAQFPGSAPHDDGVVILYKAIGRFPANPNQNFVYNQGRTATHEIGHWLGLEHIWGTTDTSCNDSDDIEDTPNQDDANGGCPTGTITSCDNSRLGGDMYQNFMDYTDDACMNLFTKDQAEYMNKMINSERSGLLTSAVCEFPLRADFSASDSVIVTGTTVQFNDNSIGVRATEWLWTFEGGIPGTSTKQNPEVKFNNVGQYTVTLTVTAGDLTSTKTKTSYIIVTYGEPRIYPNPATGDEITIALPADYEVANITLVNALGQLVRIGSKPVEAKSQINIAGLAAGVYLAKITLQNGKVVSKRVVVLH